MVEGGVWRSLPLRKGKLYGIKILTKASQDQGILVEMQFTILSMSIERVQFRGFASIYR